MDVGEQFVEEGLTSRIDVSVPKTPLTSEGSGDEAGTYEETVSPLPVCTTVLSFFVIYCIYNIRILLQLQYVRTSVL